MTEFRPEEIEHAKRPPTDAERKAMTTMPRMVAVGWLERKRTQELAEAHGINNVAEGLEALVAELRERSAR